MGSGSRAGEEGCLCEAVETLRTVEAGMLYVSCSLWIAGVAYLGHSLCVQCKPGPLLPSTHLLLFSQQVNCFYVSTFERSHCATFGNLTILLLEFNDSMLSLKHWAETLPFGRACVDITCMI